MNGMQMNGKDKDLPYIKCVDGTFEFNISGHILGLRYELIWRDER